MSDPGQCAGTDSASPRPRRGRRRAPRLKASTLLKNGLDLLAQGHEERALKIVTDIPRLYPTSTVRFQAHAALAKYHMDKGSYDLALRQCRMLAASEEPDHQAEALYHTGICHFSTAEYDKAFLSLRKVTTQFPWSVYANEAFYYIGQCHFKLGRWSKAVEALEMVGTSVPLSDKGATSAEAGQRLFVKIIDRDLVVLKEAGKTLTVSLKVKSGDIEKVVLSPLGRTGEYYIGSVQTALGKPAADDGTLQIVGGDSVEIAYVDANTQAGEANRRTPAIVNFVSSATVGFTDGAYREYVRGVFADGNAFIRVKDMDRDATDKQDKLTVTVGTRY